MAERGPRPVFDTPSAGSSPVPAGYGSLGAGFPRTGVPDRQPRERKPFRWKVWRDDQEDPGGDLDGDIDEVEEGPPSRTRSPVAYARTSGGAVSTPAPAPRRERSTTPVGGGPVNRRVPAGDPAPAPVQRRTVPAPPVQKRTAPRTVVEEEAAPRSARRSRVVPAAPRQRLATDGRVLTGPPSPSPSSSPEPEPRPAAFLKETIRTRQIIRHLDVLTVFRVSALFYLLGVIVLLLAGVLLWNVATALGTITSIDKSIKTLFDLTAFTLRPLPVLGYSVAVGAVLVALGTLVNVLVAVIFNLISDVTGGVGIRVVAQPDDE